MFNKKLFLYNVIFGQFCSYLRSTRHKCTWASKVLDEWFSDHKKLNSNGLFKDIEGDLLKFSDGELVYVLTRFILEVKKQMVKIIQQKSCTNWSFVCNYSCSLMVVNLSYWMTKNL